MYKQCIFFSCVVIFCMNILIFYLSMKNVGHSCCTKLNKSFNLSYYYLLGNLLVYP